LAALERVGHRFVERAARHAAGRRRDGRAEGVERGHAELEAVPFGSDALRGADAAASESDLAERMRRAQLQRTQEFEPGSRGST
jgi:hypothetical protein